MAEADLSTLETGELLDQSWRMFQNHLRTFVPLMGFPVAAVVLSTIIMYFLLVPIRTGVPLNDVWVGMSVASKLGVFLLFLATLYVDWWALAASVFATQEIRGSRDVGVLKAIRYVRAKQLRLFWLAFLLGLLTGPLGMVIAGPILAFLCSPGLPVALLENVGAFRALKRGKVLSEGGYGRIALLFLLNLGLVAASAFGFFGLLYILQERLGKPWYLRPLPVFGMWVIFLVPQSYMIALTLNYFDQLKRRGESVFAPQPRHRHSTDESDFRVRLKGNPYGVSAASATGCIVR
jgi:hypothetical protein